MGTVLPLGPASIDGSHREDTSSILTTIRSDLIAFIEDAKETTYATHAQAFIPTGAR